MCVCVYFMSDVCHIHAGVSEARKGCWIPWNWSYRHLYICYLYIWYSHLMWYWDPNPDPVEEQYPVLTAEPSLQPC